MKSLLKRVVIFTSSVIALIILYSCKEEEYDGDTFYFVQPSLTELSEGWEYTSYLAPGLCQGGYQPGLQCPEIHTQGNSGWIILDFPEWVDYDSGYPQYIGCSDSMGLYTCGFFVGDCCAEEDFDYIMPDYAIQEGNATLLSCGLKFTIDKVQSPEENRPHVMVCINLDNLNPDFRGDILSLTTTTGPFTWTDMKVYL